MGTCEYCGQVGKQTKEHVLPSWLCDDTAHYDAQVVRGPNGLKYYPNNLTIKDVCAACNNGELSRLDAYAKSLWDQELQAIVRPGDRARRVEVDADQLVRWVAKVSYNMARASARSRDADVLKDLSSFLLGVGPPRRRVALYHGILMPTPITDSTRASLSDPSLTEAAPGVRLAVIDDPRVVGSESAIATVRILGLHSHVFFLVVSERPVPSRQAWRRALRRFEKLVPMARPVAGALLATPSEFDLASFDVVPMSRSPREYEAAIKRGRLGRGGRP